MKEFYKSLGSVTVVLLFGFSCIPQKDATLKSEQVDNLKSCKYTNQLAKELSDDIEKISLEIESSDVQMSEISVDSNNVKDCSEENISALKAKIDEAKSENGNFGTSDEPDAVLYLIPPGFGAKLIETMGTWNGAPAKYYDFGGSRYVQQGTNWYRLMQHRP